MAFCLLFLLANVVTIWIVTRVANQAAVYRMVARDAHRLGARVEGYREETGLYPDPATWQQWVTASDAIELLDPWRRPYLYRITGRSFSITTYGADGQPGGSGEDKDLMIVFPYATSRMSLPHAEPKTADTR